MNILMLTPLYYPAIGGGETHVRTLAEGICRLGNNVIVFTDKTLSSVPDYEIINGVKIFRTRLYKKRIEKKDKVAWEECYFALLHEFQDLLSKQKYKIDLIHAHCQVSVLLGAMFKDSLKCPLVASMHETHPEDDAFGIERSKLIYKYLPYDLIIAGSKYFYNQAIDFGAKASKISLVYYGIDLNRFNPKRSGKYIRKKLKISSQAPLITLIGRFKERKGQLDFVRSMYQINKVFPEAIGLLVGTCDCASFKYLKKVKTELKNLSLYNNIIIDHDFTWEEMPEVFAATDIVVQPSYSEGFGLAVLEGLATGKPVVSTDVTGIKEIIISGKNGLLVQPGSPNKLAHAIITLLKTPSLINKYKIQGLKTTKEISISKMLEGSIKAYESVFFQKEK